MAYDVVAWDGLFWSNCETKTLLDPKGKRSLRSRFGPSKKAPTPGQNRGLWECKRQTAASHIILMAVAHSHVPPPLPVFPQAQFGLAPKYIRSVPSRGLARLKRACTAFNAIPSLGHHTSGSAEIMNIGQRTSREQGRASAVFFLSFHRTPSPSCVVVQKKKHYLCFRLHCL